MNKQWHRERVLPRNATVGERMTWHREHQEHCACRPVPPKLLEKMTASPAAVAGRGSAGGKGVPKADKTFARVGDAFARVVRAFADDRQVTTGGKGFGSSGLKVNGKLFAMISSKGRFIAKLPKARVAELVQSGQARQFDPGHGRLMKEWVELASGQSSWLGLAREALRFVGGRKA